MDSKELESAIAALVERLERLETELRDARWQQVSDAFAGMESRMAEAITQLNANVMQIHERVAKLEKQHD